jgi:hypothetical protein
MLNIEHGMLNVDRNALAQIVSTYPFLSYTRYSFFKRIRTDDKKDTAESWK